MAATTRHLTLLVTLLATPFGGTHVVRAQQPAPAVESADEPSADATPDEPSKPPRPILSSPAVLALSETKSDDPKVLLGNVFTLIDLDAAEAAMPLVKKIAAAGLDADQQTVLARTFGTGKLLQLMGAEALLPEGKQLAQSLLDAAAKSARDPARLTELVAQLGDPQQASQTAFELRRAGQDGALFCLSSLADPTQAPLHDKIAAVLATFGPLAKGPLLAALESDNPEFRARVIGVLNRMKAAQAAVYLFSDALGEPDSSTAPAARSKAAEAARAALVNLVGAVPSRPEAEALLVRQIKRLLNGDVPLARDYTDRVELWQWDDQKKKAAADKRTAREAGALLAARLANDLARIAPGATEHRRLRLLTALEAEKVLHGLDAKLPTGPETARELSKSLSPDDLTAVLSAALNGDHRGAALGALDLIAERADASLLVPENGEPSPIVRALSVGSRRVRFAALRTIMRLDPISSYPGASHVAEALGYFARTSRSVYSVLGDRGASQAATLSALLAGAGVETLVAATGAELIHLAGESADVEMALVDMRLRTPAVREVVYRLRRQPATTHLPIALVAESSDLARAKQLAVSDPLTLAALRPIDEASAAALLEKMKELDPRGQITPEQRREQAIEALRWLAELSARPETVYDLGRLTGAAETALGARGLAKHAAAAVANLGRASGQLALVRLAGRPTATIEDRQVAAEAFRRGVARHGLLLTSTEINMQYAIYNASETADAATQQVLAAILDTIESKSRKPKSD